MSIIALIFCLVALFERKANRKTARMYMTGAIVAYAIGIIISWTRVIMNPSIYHVSVTGFVINITALTLMIIARVKLNSEPTNSTSKVNHQPSYKNRNSNSKTTKSVDYKALSKEIFDVCADLTSFVSHLMAKFGAGPFSTENLQTSTLYGTGLYEWSILLLREKMHKIYPNKVEFESEDNKMIEIFAETMQMPTAALLKIVDRNGSIKDWEEKMLIAESAIPLKGYMSEIKAIVDKATRGLIKKSGEGPSEHEKFGSSEDDEMMGEEDLEDDLSE